jgi:CRP-like cAMP-binding protein
MVDLAQHGPQICNPPTYCRYCLLASALATELTADQLDALFDVIEVRKLSKNEILISEGAYDDHLYALAKGELEISRAGERGQEALGRIHPGSIAGELAFLDGMKRHRDRQSDR